MSTDQQLGWLRNLSKAQLSEATLAVVQIQKEVNALATRVNGEHELRSLGWERRLALAKREWQDDLEAMRTECSIMLKEADELVALQREEAELYREEALLRVAQRDAAEQKVLMLQGSQRRLVLRARGALRRAEEAEAEAAEATAAADRASASNEAARRRAEAERDVLVAALAIGEGEDGYLERIAHDQSLPVAQRESAMLRAKLQDLRDMAAKHAVDAGAVAHAMAEVELREARAERRAQALEQRLRQLTAARAIQQGGYQQNYGQAGAFRAQVRDSDKQRQLDRVADQIAAKFGKSAIRRGARLDGEK